MTKLEGQNQKSTSHSTDKNNVLKPFSNLKVRFSALTSTDKGKYITLLFIGFVAITGFSTVYLYSTNSSLIPVSGDQILNIKLNQREEDLSFFRDQDTLSNVEYILEAGGHFEPGVDIYKVGDEYITTDDFNLYFYENNPSSYYNNEPISGDQIKNATDELIKQSVLAQSFAQDNDELKETLYTTRLRAYEQYKDRGQVLEKEINDRINENAKRIVGESLTVWFYNMVPPPMGVEGAREIAYEKISEIKTRLDSGEISMTDAAKILTEDKELLQLNPALLTNTYSPFTTADGVDVFFDKEVNDVLFSLSEGEHSDILVGKDYGRGTSYDAYFLIIKVNEVSGSGDTPDQIYEEIKSNYPIIEL